ncbi:hypothetical protein LDENG_00175110 [Lucifuga dentata]|nr:hypothetical protein LDENG_00175110 [Lucifuga dentata]
MISQAEKQKIRTFVCRQLRDTTNLSTLTLGTLKRQYLALVGCDSISVEAKIVMKRAVEEELMKMQESDKDDSELETRPSQNKRKREKENEAIEEGADDNESRAKKSRCQSSSSVLKKKDCSSGSEESEEEDGEEGTESGAGDAEQELSKPQMKTNGTSEDENTSEDDTDEEQREWTKPSKKEENNSNDSLNEIKGKAKPTENRKKKSRNTSKAKKMSPRKKDETGSDSESESSETHDSSDSEQEEKVTEEKKKDELAQDSDSSSLPSLEDEQHNGAGKSQATKKKKTMKRDRKTEKEEGTKNKDQKDQEKAILSLKRYISLCGVRRNYKKLFDGCHSVRSKVAVLKKELEDLGVKGRPSVEKCKKIRLKREEAEELADLDVSNIITTQGRPKRRGASAFLEKCDPASSSYQRTLNSSSDSEDNYTGRGRRRAKDWANLQGIITIGQVWLGMDDDTPDEVFADLKTKHIGGWGVAQIAAGTGLAIYAVWVGILQPGFRKVPLRLQVPYIPASKAQVCNVMTLLRGRKGNLMDLGSGDGRIVLEAHRQGFSPVVGYELNPWLVQLARFHAWRAGQHGKVAYRREDLWKVDLTDCKNVTVFLAPSVLSLLQEKLHAELPDDALVVAGRFPFPDWTPCMTEGHGVDRAWAYTMQAQRRHFSKKSDTLKAIGGHHGNEVIQGERKNDLKLH